MKSNSTNHTNHPVVSNSDYATETLIVVLIICMCIFIISVLFFSIVRFKYPQIYSPRLLLLKNREFSAGRTSKTFSHWMTLNIFRTDDDIYAHSGIDALVFIRFLKLILKLALFTLPYGMLVLLPINIYGGNKLVDWFDKMSMSNIKSGSNLLWVHWFGVWLYTFLIIHLTFEEWKVYTKYKQNYLKKGIPHQFVVFLQGIPNKYLEQETLKREIERLFPNKVYGVHIVTDHKVMRRLIRRHDKYVWRWKRAKHDHDSKQTTEIMSKNQYNEEAARKKQDDRENNVLLDYEKKLELLQEEMIIESNRLRVSHHSESRLRPSHGCAFVFMKSLKARTCALQSKWHADPFVFQPIPAPAASEVLWESLKIGHVERYIRMSIGYAIVFVLVLSWIVPITFISSLASLKSLAMELKWLDNLANGSSKIVSAIIQGILPVFLVVMFYWLLPHILRVVAKLQGHISQGNIVMMVFKSLFIFHTFNTFFIYIISGAFIKTLPDITKPFDYIAIFTEKLPSQSGFFLSYLALWTFVGLSLELTRIWSFVITMKLKWTAKTPREKLEAWKPVRAHYETMYSQALLFFLIGITYSILSPIIIPFFVLYYAFASVVWIYQLIHVYVPQFDYGGKFWPCVFSRMIILVICFQVLMLTIFILKHSWYIAVMLTPLLVITLVYWWVMSNRYGPHCEHLALSVAVETVKPVANEQFLKKVWDSYAWDYNIPEMFEMSTDAQTDKNENFYDDENVHDNENENENVYEDDELHDDDGEENRLLISKQSNTVLKYYGHDDSLVK